MAYGRHSDEMIQEAIEYGERNAEVIRLVERHCAHARVEIVGGIGLVEQQTALPIGTRAMRCEHAEDHGFAGMDFGRVAVNFYNKNCVGCPHHEPVAGPPDLASFVVELDEAAESRRGVEERERGARLQEYETRAKQRRLAAQDESYATRGLLLKLDLVDAENPDDTVARQIVESARGVPDMFTRRAVEILFDTAETTRSRRLVEALRWLAHHGRAPVPRVVELALRILSETPMTEAAHVLLDYRNALDVADVAPVHRSLIRLAGRVGHYSIAEPAPMLMAAAIDLAGVLHAMHEMLESDSDYIRGLAASAAGRLIEQDIEVVPVLCRAVANALRQLGAIHRLGSNDTSDGAIERTLSVALTVAPEAARDAIESAARGLDGDARVALFAAYDDVLRSRLSREEVPPKAGDIVVRATLQRLAGDWGTEAAQRASNTLELCAKYHPHLLVPHVDAIVGALLDEIRRPVDRYHPILDLSPHPNVLRALESQSEEIAHNRRLYDLREALGQVVVVAPSEVGEHIFTLLDAPDIDVAEANETKALAIRLIGPVGRHPSLTSRALPHLYSGLLSSDNLRRAYAIEAWEEMAHPRDRRLPMELDVLLQPLLADRYVIVHKAMIKALRDGLPVPRDQALEVALMLVRYANHYGDDKDDFGETAYQALEAARRVARLLDPQGYEFIIELVLATAAKLHPYKLGHLLRHRMDELVNRPRYADRLLDLLCSTDELTREEDHVDELVHVPSPVIAERAYRVEQAITKSLPDDPWHVHRYIEVLQLAGEWELAARITAKAEAAIPDTTENRRIRRQLGVVRAGAEFEAALARGDHANAESAAGQWTTALDAWEAADSEFDPLTDLKDLRL